MRITNLLCAFRFPFISISVSAFIFGSLISRDNFNLLNFFLGLISVVATHLGANLINDYADSKSGVDWLDKETYQFFGGSKLIQKGVFSERFYFQSAIGCFVLALLSVLVLSISLKNIYPIIFYLIILLLGLSYSCKPLQFSYHQMGELIIFLLFGPALVMGGYFIQTKVFPDFKSFMLALPQGILTAAILFANEIPDYQEDRLSGKLNWVYFFGQEKSYLVYLVLIGLAFISIGLNTAFGFLSKNALYAFIFVLPAAKAAAILKKYFNQKAELIQSAKLTILVHTWVSVALIADVLI